MKRVLASLTVGLTLGGFVGWFAGYRAADNSWKQRAITGVAVDCYDAQGLLVPDSWAKFGGVQMSCAPGQTARVHQPKSAP
ncbi:MAG: hypothetical protein WB729_06380 [Candidatus Sulfotelmatobacter sp.]